MDLTTLDTDELNDLRIAVLTEQERRARLASIPLAITALAQQYVAGGGDVAALSAALPAPIEHVEPEPEPTEEPPAE